MRPHRARSAAFDPQNRCREIRVELDPAELTDDDLTAPTRYFDDASRTIIARNAGSDIPGPSPRPWRTLELVGERFGGGFGGGAHDARVHTV